MAELTPEERKQADLLDRAMGSLRMDAWDKDGNRITQGEAMVLHHRGAGTDQWYPRVALDVVGGFEISTVWLWMDHAHFKPEGYDGPGAIFETMVFGMDDNHDLEVMDRYPDIGSALLGHQRVVKLATEAPEALRLILRGEE